MQGVARRDEVEPAFREVDDPYANIRAALAIEVAAVRQQGAEQRVLLANGHRIESSADHHLYRFTCTEPPLISDDTPVSIHIGQQVEEGSVVSIQGNAIVVSLTNDFGPGIASCHLQVDMSFLVETLRKRYEAIGLRMGGGSSPTPLVATRASEKPAAKADPAAAMAAVAAWDRGIPDILLGRTTTRTDVEGPAWTQHGVLRPQQIAAVEAALRHPVTLIWGPPGTGKSTTVAALIAALLARNNRILVVSNTNLAVDGLLEKVIDVMMTSGVRGPVEAGAIVRHGVLTEQMAYKTAPPPLQGTLADYVTVEQIVARRSQDLTQRRVRLLEAIARLEQEAADAVGMRAAFQDLDRTRLERQTAVDAWEAGATRLPVARSEASILPDRLAALRQELTEYLRKGLIGKLFSGTTEASLQDQISVMDQQLQDARRDAAELPKRMDALRDRKDDLEQRVRALEQRTAGYRRDAIEARCEQLNREQAAPRAELADVDRQLAAIQTEVIAQCRCLFATSTQVFLKPKQFAPAFDVVIIEEATMLLLPAAVYAAGLAKSQVVITGDYRQLPAIVMARDPASQRWLATDLFCLTNNADQVPGVQPRAPKLTLQVQNRMVGPICDLINPVFYDGLLQTTTAEDRTIYPEPIGQVFTVLDTSAETPFVRLKPNTYSRYSLLHAHAIRNLCMQLVRGGVLGGDIAVMSPYRAQVQILAKLLEPVDGDIAVGTVHRFQGQERRVVIFDICDSHGLPHLSRFIAAVETAEAGARMLNVALSRAKHRVIVVANLPFLDRHLPASAILRDILYQMGTRGSIVPSGTVFAAIDMPTTFTTGFAPETRSVYRETDFEAAFMSDLARAERYVVIQSAFLTPQRLAGWELAFRELIARHVRIRIVTRPPETQGSIQPEQVREALDLAQRLGLIVDLRNMIHQKSAIIDGTVVWHGSLNILSFTSRSEESMYRILSPPLAEIEAQFDTVIRRKTREGARGDLADRENPACPNCGSLTVLHPTGRFGAWLRCLDQTCAWKCSVDRLGHKAAGPVPILDHEVSCPACSRPMQVRTGRTGYFLGCSGYPACRQTKPLDGADPESGGGSRKPPARGVSRRR
jgi:predicted  nucleic acid-binding Zn-ribbon protein